VATSSQQLSFRTSRLRKLAAGVAATTVVVVGLVALTRDGKRPVSIPPAPASAAFVNGWSTRTGGVLAGQELSAVASGAYVNGWSTRTGGVLAGHDLTLVADTSGAYVDGWSTRTGGVLASQQLRCADPHGAYVDGWSTRTGGDASC
jgi:hypothetical protein